MEAWVLGCGPSLGEVCIPPDAFTIGTNTSYTIHWSPVWAGGDLRAIRRDYALEDAQRPLVWFTAIDPAKVSIQEIPGRPLIYIPFGERPTLRKAGVFAYWLACNVFKATKVHLVGFDMELAPTHYDGTKADVSYVAQRRQLVEIQRACGTESWIFVKDSFMPVEKLPYTGVRISKSMMYTGFENDITDSLPLPQEFWRQMY